MLPGRAAFHHVHLNTGWDDLLGQQGMNLRHAAHRSGHHDGPHTGRLTQPAHGMYQQ
jgi:hypothetical protein